jgi:hypothetical protein
MSNFDELPETFDPSTHEGTRDLEPVPPGWYLTQIVENGGEHAKNSNGTYLRTVFEILDGEYKGRKIFQNITLQNDSQQAVEIGARLLKDIYDAIGHNEPTRDIHVMLFKPVMARVGIKRDKDGIYPDRNAVAQVKPRDYQPKRRPGSGPSGTAPVAPRGPTFPPASAAAGAAPTATPPVKIAPSGDAPWRS